MKRFQTIYTLIFSLALIAFSAYALLDSFVIRRVYSTVEPAAEPAAASVQEAYVPETLSAALEPAEEEDTRISLSQYRWAGSTVYVADILTDSPTAIRSALAQNSYGRNVSAASSAIAEQVGAVLAVNGDNYGSREKGYVIRNGVLYRSTAAKGQEDLVIWADGSFSLIREAEVSAEELLAQGAEQVLSFGPGLLEDGLILVDTDDEVDRAKASNPRTAIGMIEPGHYVLVVSDGRSSESQGLSLYELAAFMQSLGVQTAYNLDGGGSSTMVYEGQVINTPSGRGGNERAVTDILYIM